MDTGKLSEKVMPVEAIAYRGHEVKCTVSKEKVGKPSIKWTCLLSISQNAQAAILYEVSVNAWNTSVAQSLGLQLAKEHIDDALGIGL